MNLREQRRNEFEDRLRGRLDAVPDVEPTSLLAEAIIAAGVAAHEDVEEAQSSRRRCVLCGEPIVLCDPDDAESWVHAEDASDWGDHSAEVEGALLSNGGAVLGEGVAGERLS